MSQPQAPAAPNFAQQYAQGMQVYMKNLPKFLKREMAARRQYDPQRIEEAQMLQRRYGPEQYREQLDAWKQLDPYGYSTRQSLGQRIQDVLQRGYISPTQKAAYEQLGTGVRGEYARGTTADPESLRQMSQAIRSRQGQDTALGNAPAMAEAVYIGQRGQQLQQQRTGNIQNFLGIQSPEEKAIAEAGMFQGLPSPMSQINQISSVQPDRASAYVNPNAGYQGAQWGLQNFQNQMASSQMGTNPWMGALGGAASGAAAGATMGGGNPYAIAGGALVGGVGGYFSDARLKQNISRTGTETRDGIPIVEFDMAGHRYRGVLAHDVLKVKPEAVGVWQGFYTVDYDQLGIQMQEVL